MPQLTIGFVVGAVIVILALIALSAFVSWKSAISYRIKVGEAKVGSSARESLQSVCPARREHGNARQYNRLSAFTAFAKFSAE